LRESTLGEPAAEKLELYINVTLFKIYILKANEKIFIKAEFSCYVLRKKKIA